MKRRDFLAGASLSLLPMPALAADAAARTLRVIHGARKWLPEQWPD